MQPERRFSSPGLGVERRATGEGEGQGQTTPILKGYSARFNDWTTIWESDYLVFREVVRPGAFTRAVVEDDVRSLLNHNSDYILGRTKAGTLRLSEDEQGLFQETSLLDTQFNRERIILPAERGDLDSQSFAFVADNRDGREEVRREGEKLIVERSGERWTEWIEGDRLVVERELLSVRLYDVSIVTFPAYRSTTALVVRKGTVVLDFAEQEREARERLAARGRVKQRFLMDSALALAGA